MTLAKKIRRIIGTATLLSTLGASAAGAEPVACLSGENPPVLMADIDGDKKIDRIRIQPGQTAYGKLETVIVELDTATPRSAQSKWKQLARANVRVDECYKVTVADKNNDGLFDLILYMPDRASENSATILYRDANNTYAP